MPSTSSPSGASSSPRVQVRLRAQAHDLVEVRVVYVRVDAKQPTEDLRRDALKVFRKRRARGLRKRRLVVHLRLDPLEQVVHVPRRAALDRLLHLDAVRPSVLVFRSRAHRRAVLILHGVDREPLVQILPGREQHRLAEVAAPERRVDVLLQRRAFASHGRVLLRTVRERGRGAGERADEKIIN
eukprot:30595-Pelagococcus_subviridis.AAC.4